MDSHPVFCTKVAAPLSVNLALEIQPAAPVGDIAWYNEERKGDPCQEGVYGQERTIVEKDASPTDERG